MYIASIGTEQNLLMKLLADGICETPLQQPILVLFLLEKLCHIGELVHSGAIKITNRSPHVDGCIVKNVEYASIHDGTLERHRLSWLAS